MKRLGLGVLFFAWLYGGPFLLVVGLIRRTSTPYTPTPDVARAFGATTDALLTAGLVLNAALPLAGLLLAGWAGERGWRRHFGWSLGGMALLYLAVALFGSMATSTLIGHTPADQESAPPVGHCVPTSGGRGCPGG
ncbi:hypothetical protein [Micromonospora cremea]|uniref:Major facilitator superfamily (MFS) profile domain-containing protein n=1 Tax=Micromonospora cremea TaxID=709881 RepID=A0A1N5Z9R7_9ACTN|nr:hypothetical protein [Micromonospora cremea]SIN18330.1 hypothetical protein SAMN04489832_3746 [Micromonospora cremea]